VLCNMLQYSSLRVLWPDKHVLRRYDSRGGRGCGARPVHARSLNYAEHLILSILLSLVFVAALVGALRRSAVAFSASVRGAVIVAFAMSTASCYTVRIDESFWLRPRPAGLMENTHARDALPYGYALSFHRIQAAMSTSATNRVSRTFCSRCVRPRTTCCESSCWSGGSSAPSASSAGPVPSCRATTSAPHFHASSMSGSGSVKVPP
jgi:hypothetical protein